MGRRQVAVALLVVILTGCPDSAPSDDEPSGRFPPNVSPVTTDLPTGPVVVAGLTLGPESQPAICEPGPLPTTSQGVIARVIDQAGLRYPRAITVSPTGQVFVIDKQGWLRKLDAQGRLVAAVRTPEVEQGTPTGLAFGPDGRLLVADSHYGRVLTYGADLRLQSYWGRLGRQPGSFMLISGIAVDGQGRVYLTDQGDDVARVQVFDASGKYLRGFGRFGKGDGELRRPMGLAVDGSSGRVAVADALNHRVQVFSLEGEHRLSIGRLGEGPGELKHPYGVAFDARGRLIVTDFGNHRLQVFDAEGSYVGEFGQPGRAPGGLAFPWSVAVAGDRVLLTDSGNDRCYELRLPHLTP